MSLYKTKSVKIIFIFPYAFCRVQVKSGKSLNTSQRFAHFIFINREGLEFPINIYIKIIEAKEID